VQVDFYQVSRDPAEAIVAMLAEKTLGAGQRLLVVAAGGERLEAIGQALWSHAGKAGSASFLANGRAGTGHEARQPVLLAETVEPANGARFIALADGVWRDEAVDPARFDRVFLIFDQGKLEEARACWRSLGQSEDLARNYWKQEGGRWTRAG